MRRTEMPMRDVVVLLVLLCASSARAYECEDDAKRQAQDAVVNYDPAGLPDDFGLTEIIWQKELRTLVWLNARYDDGRDQTRWCVAIVMPPRCRTPKGARPEQRKAQVVRIVACPVVPMDDRLERLLRRLGWRK